VIHGSVVEFDPDAGLGTVRADDGADYLFHCVEIADGTRSIEVGTRVRFEVVAKLGRYEAARIVSWTTASDASST
jgi:CspA family cold shock protein